MTSQEYIINGLNALVEKYPAITFKYRLNKADSTHIIAVEPLKEFEENNCYLEAESDFVYLFENTYLPETVLFVSNNSLITVNEPEMTFKSNQFGLFIKELLKQPKYKFDYDLDKIEAGTNDYALAA